LNDKAHHRGRIVGDTSPTLPYNRLGANAWQSEELAVIRPERAFRGSLSASAIMHVLRPELDGGSDTAAGTD
jgi:hypothetical protein